MTIHSGSRYTAHQVSLLTGRDGITRETIMPRGRYSQSMTVVDYVWEEDDRVDLIAAQVYGDETMWWVIARANPEILDWTELPAGRIVRVPSAVS